MPATETLCLHRDTTTYSINTDIIARVRLSQHSPLTTVAALTLFQFCSITKKWWHALYPPPERMILHAQRPH